jgi:hypothetical protein
MSPILSGWVLASEVRGAIITMPSFSNSSSSGLTIMGAIADQVIWIGFDRASCRRMRKVVSGNSWQSIIARANRYCGGDGAVCQQRYWSGGSLF